MRPSIPSFTRLIGALSWLVLLAGCQGLQHYSICPNATLEVSPLNLTDDDFVRLAAAPSRNAEREEAARKILRSACSDVRPWHIRGSRHQSHSCLLPGTDRERGRIIVGAHYDKARAGDGIVDNWTGVVFLEKLLAHFAKHPPQHTMEFILFGEEEPGMLGSKTFVRAYPELDQVRAMVNLDTFGIGTTAVDKRSDRQLMCVASTVAQALDIELESRLLHVSIGDWVPFRSRGVPVLNLNSLDQRGLELIHTRRDRYQAINSEQLRESWRIVANIVINLDQVLKKEIEETEAK